MAKSWFVYILTCHDGAFYTGITTDLERRLREHNSRHSTTKYTRMRQPVKLSYSESQPSRSEAAKRESVIKSLTRAEKARLFHRL